MKKMAATITVFTLCGCSSVVHNVTLLDASTGKKHDSGGFVYSLPKTELVVAVPTTLTVTKPGQYKKDVEDYLAATPTLSAEVKALRDAVTLTLYNMGIDNPVALVAPIKHRVKLGTPTFTTQAVHDPNNVYLVSVDSGQSIDTLLSMNYDSQGFLTANSSEVNNRTADLAGKSIEIVGNLAAGLAQFGAGTGVAATPPSAPNPFTKALGFLQAIDQAQAAKTQFLMGSGKADLSLEVIKLIMEKLDRQEQAMRSYFWSKKATKWTAQIQYDPCRGTCLDLPNQPLFDLMLNGASIVGIKNANTSLIKPPPANFDRPQICTTVGVTCTTESIRVLHSAQPTAATTVGLHTLGTASNRGFRYRVPGSLVATLDRSSRAIGRAELPVAQLGVVAALPAKPGGTKSKYVIELYGTTGALKKAEVQSTGVSTALIGSFGDSGQALIDARAKREEVRAAEASAASEKTMLNEQVELLRLEKEKQELEASILEGATD